MTLIRSRARPVGGNSLTLVKSARIDDQHYRCAGRDATSVTAPVRTESSKEVRRNDAYARVRHSVATISVATRANAM